MKRMSFSKTVPQMRAQTKTVTRRAVETWKTLKAGDQLMAIEKGQGIPKGQRQKEIGPIEVLEVVVEPLGAVTRADLALEGLGHMTKGQFLDLFPGDPGQMVRRILFRHLGPTAGAGRATRIGRSATAARAAGPQGPQRSRSR